MRIKQALEQRTRGWVRQGQKEACDKKPDRFDLWVVGRIYVCVRIGRRLACT